MTTRDSLMPGASSVSEAYSASSAASVAWLLIFGSLIGGAVLAVTKGGGFIAAGVAIAVVGAVVGGLWIRAGWRRG